MSTDRSGARVEFFTSGLSDRLAQIRWALEQLRQRPQDTGLFAETRNWLHELAGTADSFGLEELSEIGTRLEQALGATALDLLFVNAGVCDEPGQTIGLISDEEFDWIFKTNVLGPMRTIETLAPVFAT